MRGTLCMLALLALAGCKGVGLSQMDTEAAAPPPGLSHLDTESEESRENQKWFDGYYGKSHGWGWEAPKEKDANCSFWGSCAEKSSGGLGW